MGPKTDRPRALAWVVLLLSAAMAAAWLGERFVRDRPTYDEAFAPGWLPVAAAGLAAAAMTLRLGLLSPSRGRELPRLERGLQWGSLLLMVWAAGGLLIDLLRVAGRAAPVLMPHEVDWTGLVVRTFALGALIALARLALTDAYDPGVERQLSSAATSRWYGYAALACALPYPVVKTCWALGATIGLLSPGAAGHVSDGAGLDRFLLWLPAVPWLLAAVLSVLLVATPVWMPRRLLLAGAWAATAIVATVGPAACWALVFDLIAGRDPGEDIRAWVFGLFYGSWFLWALAAGAATLAYQRRSAARRTPSPA